MSYDPFNNEQEPDWVTGNTNPVQVGAPITQQVQQAVQTPVQPQQQARPQQQPVQSQQTIQQQMASCPATDFDLSSLDGVAGVSVGDVGEVRVTNFPVNKMKFKKDINALIGIVSNKCVAVKLHYSDASKSYLCWGGKCCEVDGYAKTRYLFPIVVYDTDKKGAPISKNLDYRVLVVGGDAYNDLITKKQLHGDLTNFDILVSCEDEKFQKLKFNIAPGGARWKQNPAMSEATMAFWKENIKHIVKPVASTITEEQLMLNIARAAQSAGVDAGIVATQPRGDVNVNFNDVFNPGI